LNREAEKAMSSFTYKPEDEQTHGDAMSVDNTIFNVHRIISGDMQKIENWQNVVEEPSISDTEEEQDVDSEELDSNQSQTDQQKLA
jgi:hypothetical protein